MAQIMILKFKNINNSWKMNLKNRLMNIKKSKNNNLRWKKKKYKNRENEI